MDSAQKSDRSLNRRGSINDLAQERFETIKSRMKLNLFRDAVVSENYPQRDVDSERIQQLLDHPEQNDRFEVKEESVQKKIESVRVEVDDIFAKINSLGLPNKLSMAVGFIVSAMKNQSRAELMAAIGLLQTFVDEEMTNANTNI